jgi:hypothetical protein
MEREKLVVFRILEFEVNYGDFICVTCICVLARWKFYICKDGARPALFHICVVLCIVYFCVVLCICFVSFCVLFVCKCVLYNCQRVATQLQLTNISKICLVEQVTRASNRKTVSRNIP